MYSFFLEVFTVCVFYWKVGEDEAVFELDLRVTPVEM